MIKQLEEIRDTLYEFLETRIELFRVETRGRIEDIILKTIYAALVVTLSTVLIIFLLILLAVYLNHRLQNPYAGYACVAGFFLLCLLFCILFRSVCLNLIRGILEKVLKN